VSGLAIESIEAVGGHDASTPVEPTARTRKRTPVAKLRIAELERDPDVNCRAGGVSARVAADYAEALRGGTRLPPVVVFRDPEGRKWLADGFHRVQAHELAERDEVEADVRNGSRRDALLHAAGANAAHGARRTNADKRRAVGALLADPEWLGKGDAWIAERCAVSDRFVAKLRPSNPNGSGLKREGRDGKLRRVPKRKGKLSREQRTEREASKAIARTLAALTRKHAGKRLPVLYTQARGWMADLESMKGGQR
jgi:hypothetical protein